MTDQTAARVPWLAERERGPEVVIRAAVWLALTLGRRVLRLALYPVCLYFLMASARLRGISREFLARVLDQPPTLLDILRHFHRFAACVLDRVYLLNDEIDGFELTITGEAIVADLLQRGQGCLLLGAHLGSFEVLRALGRSQPGLRMTLLMHSANARKINAALSAINPALDMEIIEAGRFDSMIEIEDRLKAGHFVGILADRGLSGDGEMRLPFLGDPAAFPMGPFRMAAIFRSPAVLMVGLNRGGRRYDIAFETLATPADFTGRSADSAETLARRYAARIEHHVRTDPFNWFNFFDFWR